MDYLRRQSWLVLTTLLLAVDSVAFPYTPSSVFLSPQHNGSLAYLLQPSAEGKSEFLSLNLSSTIDSSNPAFQTLLPETPFHSTDRTSAFTPAIDDRGTITVYAGDCHNSSGVQTIWRFQPDNTTSNGNGTWSQHAVTPEKGPTRPNHLAAGFAFASSNTSDSSMYVFGGMCPFQNSTDQDWVSAANYSQSMVQLGPTGPTKEKYDATITGHRAPPVPEAGMAIVPLPAAYSLSEKQQNFLFIGGQTQRAFLNMSQLAIFSVPQESWSFVRATSQGRPRTELAIRDRAVVEPRSGHAAVLSDDGKKVFLIGGWVGDTSTPADPQFAVLQIGEGYGGHGEWSWTTPSSEGAGIAEGTGLFGHSAVMLPGGMLMITGGYSIPKQSSKRALNSAQRNSKVYLYNSTSNSWVSSYTNPAALSHKSTALTGGGLSAGQKAGLGIGLGIGIPLAIVLALCAWNYYRKRGVRNQRDSQLRELALGAERAHFWGRDDPYQASSIRSSQMSEKRNPSSGYSWSKARNSTGRPIPKDPADGQAEKTGLLEDVPSPTKQIPPENRPLSQSRYYRSSGYNDWRRSDTSEIHPIDEREEDEAIFRERVLATVPSGKHPQVHDSDDPFIDTPFATLRSTIFGVGLGPFYSRRKDIAGSDSGRVSPAKSDRTATSLSEVSSFSFASSSKPTGNVAQTRGAAERPLSWASGGRQSLEHLAQTHSRETTRSELDGMTAPSEKSYSADSYSTAQSTISERLAEGTSLLFDADAVHPGETSPSKLPPASKPRASEWMLQTVRRALTLTRRGIPVEPDLTTAQLASGVDRRSTVIGPGPTPAGSGANTPRRAVSASAELFRRKQGAKDWNAKKRMSDIGAARSTRDDLFLGAPGYLGNDETCDDEDWDVEGAAEDRRVQTTFTVPREKLRVVNASDLDNVSERSVSRGLVGAGSRRVSG
ncbi:hypothetical protein N7492_004810 [Penicillium capsulatum]|uniref:Galactose oxidase/kelch, beta-propeller n=1 Tax=Penicillium capsulatum TaxID=69766 RepID=A0A9W9IEK5_9EURO|nr:hypothetical protein N7492_004810 [Penicillium capsulatum]KAJ6136081.1 hypothetical protein N7512_001241 [Penicillium capsulatum]